MTDYRDLSEVQQNNIIRHLMTEGMYGKIGEEIELGELCAICWNPAHICLCSHDDDEE